MPTQHRSRPRTQDRSTANTGEALRSIFNRNFNVVACINLLVMTAYYLMFVTSTAYARATYGASLSSAGLTAGIMVIGCLIGRFLTGNLLSLCGCRAILFAGLLLYSASIAAFFWVPNLALLFVQRLCMGMGVGIMGTATGTIVAYVVPHQHHGLGISLFSMSTAFALALGPFTFDFERMDFRREGAAIELSKAEQKLLRVLVENRGHAVCCTTCRRCATATGPSLSSTATSTRVWCVFRWWRSSPA